MRIFFIGTVDFSYKALETLLNNKFEIVGVATKSKSEFNSDFKDLSPLCELNNINYKFVNDVNHENNISFIKSCKPDIIYCFGWSNLIKKDILSLPKQGVIGFHPSLLPNNRGRHPIIWALALGLKKTGSSFFYMDEGADTGDLISQKPVSITEDDTALTLYSKITRVALVQIVQFSNALILGFSNRTKQDLNKGNTWRKRTRKDGRIDFRMTSESIHNLVRALTYPYVGAHIETCLGDVKVWEVRKSEADLQNIEPGKVLELKENAIRVKTADGSIWLLKHEFPAPPNVNEYL